MTDHIEPETARLIEEAKATQELARIKGRHDIVERAQAVIDDLLAKDVALQAAKSARVVAEQELAMARLEAGIEDAENR